MNNTVISPSAAGCSRVRLYMIALVAATGGFLFGYDLSIISGELILLEQHFELKGLPRDSQ